MRSALLSGVRVAQFCVLCEVVCRPLIVFFLFLAIVFCLLSLFGHHIFGLFFEFRLLITHLVLSNFPQKNGSKFNFQHKKLMVNIIYSDEPFRSSLEP
jgi:hypothetical protein